MTIIILHTVCVILLVGALVCAYQAGYTQADSNKADEHDIKQGNRLANICMVTAGVLVVFGYTMGVLL